jgi:hypothetical protein
MSGQWPPDWGDPDEDVEAEAEQADAEADAGMSEVTAYLAALRDPVMPEAVETRISAAIAAEAVDRAKTATSGGRLLGRPPRRPKVRRGRRFRIQAISSVAACLVVAGFGYLLSQLGGSPSSSSSAASSAEALPQAAASARAANGSVILGQSLPAAAEPSASAAASGSVPFTVTVHGDAYQKSTLVSQVRQQLAASLGSASALAGSHGSPASALVACVLHVTDNTVPRLVDQATYAGTPVYVIATSSHAWVVGRGCTATNPELITSVSLAGLRGNLSALGSVEG